jgi:hypothetical protein
MRTGYDALGDLRQKRLAFELALARSGPRLSEVRTLTDRVHRKLSRDALWSAARALDRGQADSASVDELIAFAFDCWPRAATLPGYRTLQLRRRVGPKAVTAAQPLLVTPLAHRAHGWVQRRSWKYRGF